MLRISAYPDKDEFAIAVSDSGDTTSRPDLWYVRGDRATRVDTLGVETADAPIGDVSASVIAVIHPELAIAYNGWLADVSRQSKSATSRTAGWEQTATIGHMPAELRRVFFDERLGDGVEIVRYSIDAVSNPRSRMPGLKYLVSIERNGLEVAHFDFPMGHAVGLPLTPVPVVGRSRVDIENRNLIHQLAPGQVHFTEIAPHLFTVDLDSLNTRVTVAEFSDSLAVIEGAFGSGPCDVLAAAVRERFHKPVRVFAFSHLHGEYSGGTRSWVHEGATVVVPPSTEPLIHQMVDALFASHPDALQREPKKLKLQTVPQHLHLEDSTNALDIYNVPSGHTDEYFLFHFPRQRVLLTGDLMFLRPGKPFGGRSKMLAQNVAKLGLAVDTYVASWPLHGFGTKNVVTAAEFAQACADTAGAPPK